MKRELIALWGKQNLGKSETIVKVYKLLKNKYKNTEQTKLTIRNRIDVRALFILNNKIKIGIESHGDPGPRLKKSLALFRKHGCTIIICATRSYGGGAEAIDKLRRRGYEVVLWLKKISVSGSKQNINNSKIARSIIKEVVRVVEKSRGCVSRLFY